jgi:hypothetical protein
MPETISGSILADCASKILERMFFASVSGDAGEPIPPAGPMIGAAVSFTGPHSGSLAIAIETETAKTLAIDFLGLSSKDELDPEKIEDTIGELTNMVCGSTLSRFDDEGLFSLAHPSCGAHAVDMAMSGDGVRLLLDIGEGTLALRLKIESTG